jgi:hypothetical protein
MPLISCPACGSQISTEAEACPQCGHPNRATTQAAPGPKCYACSAAATTRCMWCNALSCALHVQSVNVFDGHRSFSTALLCPDCLAKGKENLAWQRAFGCVCAIIVLLIVLGAFSAVIR